MHSSCLDMARRRRRAAQGALRAQDNARRIAKFVELDQNCPAELENGMGSPSSVKVQQQPVVASATPGSGHVRIQRALQLASPPANQVSPVPALATPGSGQLRIKRALQLFPVVTLAASSDQGCRMKPGCRTVHMVPLPSRRSSVGGRRSSVGEGRRSSLGGRLSPLGSPPSSKVLPATEDAAVDAENPGVRRKSMRRLSRDFLSYCLCEDDDDFWSAPSHVSETFNTPDEAAGFFCLDENDSEAEDGGGLCDAQELTLEQMFSFDLEQFDNQDSSDLEDLFRFDLEEVAAALRRGDGLDQLQEIITKSMTAHLDPMATLPVSLGEPSLLMAGDLSGRMTPGRMTPKSTDSGEVGDLSACTSPVLEGLAKRLSESPTPCRVSAAVEGRRRCSMMQSRLSIVVTEACARSKESLVSAAAQECRMQAETTGKQADMEELTVAARECVIKSHRQRRQSLLQAAEVVELAAVCEETGHSEEWGADHLTPSQLTMQLQLVQEAIEGARQRHRQSMAQSACSANASLV